jgi:Spy/CpxP family protein refolding chaperone
MDRITKRLVIALSLSVSVNLFFAGFAVARHLLWQRSFAMHGPMLGPRGFMGHAGLGNASPDVRRILEQQGGTLREQHGALRAARAKVSEALKTDPFDKARLGTALAELQAQTSRMQSTMHATLVEVAASLDASQRKRLANAPWLLRAPGMR